MQYLLLIYENEAIGAARSQAERADHLGAYHSFTEEIVAKGQFKAGQALAASSTATAVRVRDGETLLTDGPFAETREQLGGFYWVEAEDLDEACAIAARIPTSQTGTIEVRPIMNMEA